MPIKLLGPNTEHLTNATAVWTHFTIVDAPGAYDVFEPGRPHLQLRLERRTYIEPDRPLNKYSMYSCLFDRRCDCDYECRIVAAATRTVAVCVFFLEAWFACS